MLRGYDNREHLLCKSQKAESISFASRHRIRCHVVACQFSRLLYSASYPVKCRMIKDHHAQHLNEDVAQEVPPADVRQLMTKNRCHVACLSSCNSVGRSTMGRGQLTVAGPPSLLDDINLIRVISNRLRHDSHVCCASPARVIPSAECTRVRVFLRPHANRDSANRTEPR